MKTRLIIASFFTFVIALIMAFTMRPAAVAQQESPPPTEQLQEPPEEPVPPAAETVESESPIAPDEVKTEDEEAPASVGEEAPASEEGETGAPDTGEEDTLASEEGTVEAAETEEMVFDFAVLEGEEDVAVRNEDEETLSVDFPDEEIRSVLRIVADLFDLNLVVPETLVGQASIKLRDVTWRQVFDVVLSPVGFTYVEEGNIVKVVSLESLTLEPPVTVVVILNYAQSSDVLPTIERLVNAQTGGRVQVDKRSNALVITERPTQLRRIESIIEALDKPNVQVMIESKFIETRNRNLENIGINWTSLDGYGVRAGPMTHEFNREKGRENQRLREQGVENGVPVASDVESNLNFSDTSRITNAVFSADQFNVILSALRTVDDVKLVSNPTVVTLNNRPARIHIGESYPLVTPRFNPQTGITEAGETEWEDLGITLDVTPQVNNTNFINLEIKPTVSALVDTVLQFGASYPIISKREAETNVTIKDGFTVAIGGLVQQDTINVDRRVPVLGSIPVLGRLFRSNSSDADQRNLIIFVTARSLSPDGSGVEEMVDPRVIHQMGITRDEIPGYRPDIPMWPEEEMEQSPKTDEDSSASSNPDSDAEAEAAGKPVGEEQVETESETDAEPEAGIELIPTALTESEGESEETTEPSSSQGTPEESSTEEEAGDVEPDSLSPVEEEESTEEEEGAEEATVPAEAEPEAEPARRSGWLIP